MYSLSDGLRGEGLARNTSENLIKRTISFLGKGNSRPRLVAAQMGLDRDQTISGQKNSL